MVPLTYLGECYEATSLRNRTFSLLDIRICKDVQAVCQRDEVGMDKCGDERAAAFIP